MSPTANIPFIGFKIFWIYLNSFLSMFNPNSAIGPNFWSNPKKLSIISVGIFSVFPLSNLIVIDFKFSHYLKTRFERGLIDNFPSFSNILIFDNM